MTTTEELQFSDQILDEIIDKTVSLSLANTVLISKEIVCEMIDGAIVEVDDVAETDVPSEIDQTEVASQLSEIKCPEAANDTDDNTQMIVSKRTDGDSQWTTPETEAMYLALWDKRKLIAEQEAEYYAKGKLRQFEKEDKTLEQVIDSCLKEYSEMYEAAHTVRLKFELEKAKFTAFVQKMLATSSTQCRGGGYGDEWTKFEGMAFEDLECDEENAVKDSNTNYNEIQRLQPKVLGKRKRFVTPSREHGA